MTLRFATDSDIPEMLKWRNQEANRFVMFNQDVISDENHRAWWAKSKNDESKIILIFEYFDKPVGVVNFFDFDSANQSAHWGFYLDADYLSKTKNSIPAWIQLESEVINFSHKNLKLNKLICETFEENRAVLRLHLKHNFAVVDIYEKEISGHLKRVVETHLDLRAKYAL